MFRISYRCEFENMQAEFSGYPISKLMVNHPRLVVLECVLASMQPALRPVDLDFQWTIEGQNLLIRTAQWGAIGKIMLENVGFTKTEILFFPPPFPSLQETEQIESAIRSEILKNRGTLADVYDNREKVLQIMAGYLYKRNLVFLVEIRDWLAYALGIWGLTQERSVPVDFNFLIDGTPAQFGVMLRHFFPTYHSNDTADHVTVVVMKPEGFELREIPAEINPILVGIFSGRSRIGIISHTTPNRSSLLRVSIFGDSKAGTYGMRSGRKWKGWPGSISPRFLLSCWRIKPNMFQTLQTSRLAQTRNPGSSFRTPAITAKLFVCGMNNAPAKKSARR